MAWGFIKSQQGAATTVSTLAVTTQAVRVNSLVVVSIKFLNSAVSGVSVTDNASTPNTYAKSIGPITVSNSTMYQFYGVAVTGGATSVTANWTTNSSLRITVDEFSGGLLTNATVFDTSTSNTATSGTSGSLSTPLAPAAAQELIVAAIGWNATISSPTAGSNYLLTTNNSSTTTEYRLVGTTSETCPITWTTSTNWSLVASCFKPANTTANFMQFI